jgi:glycosyltransferase involved in cell wall biosynthesis
MPSVDVVIPCYQYGRFLRDSVSSVLGQGINNLRVLVIDNASTDDSFEVASQLAAEDPRIEVISHPTNLGATASYNEGVEWASADYFLLLDADDLLAPGSLERAIAILEKHPEVVFTHGREANFVACPAADLVDHRIGRHPVWRIATGKEFIERLCRTPVNCIGANTVVRRTAAQKMVGFYRSDLRYTDDLEMWLRLASVGSVADTPSVQAIRRVHGSQMSVHYQSVQVRDFIERERAFESFFRNEGNSVPDTNGLLRQARRSLGEHAYWSALSHVCRGQVRDGMSLLKFSFQRHPRGVLVPPVGWLLRMDRPLSRMAEVASEVAVRGRGFTAFRSAR